MAAFGHLAQSAVAQPASRTEAPARGLVRAIRTAALSSDLITPVAALPLREGDRFSRGDLLIEFDCRRQRHELDALGALVQEAKVNVDSNGHLLARGAANRNDVATANARHEKALADWSALSVRLTMCKVVAPFDGVITELAINAHETPSPGKPFMAIVSDRQLELEIIIPSRLLSLAGRGDVMQFAIDESGARHEVVIRRTGGAIDPVSQTVKIYAEFKGDAKDILPGMSGTALPIGR